MSKMFLTQTEQPLTELKVPGVYRKYPGSNTIILTQVKENYVEFIPMDAEGLDVARCSIYDFRADYVSMPYSPEAAAKKYLAAKHIACSERAQELLGLIANSKEITMTDPVAEALSKKRAARKNTKAQEIADSAAKHKQASDEKKAAKKAAAAKEKPAKAAKKAGEKKEGTGRRGQGIGAFCKEKILAGVAPEKIIEQAQAKFPGCKVNSQHISWYRARLREEGKLKD